MPGEEQRRSPLSYVEVTEQKRLNEAREQGIPWKKWGPYLSERQWGTVREDYSTDGNAWDYFTHDQSRSRAYRWGEDGLAGISDDRQQLCFALALWNGRDPILKERLFGLTNSEGNHGEDVKEYYFYLDSTPTHSYMKYLYKYPQAAYPYRDLVETNRRRSREDSEYELLDTGVFDEDRYFDVFVEYAKADPEDMLIRISVHNRGPETAQLHVLPTLWFRNTWSWEHGEPKPVMGQIAENEIRASHPQLGDYTLQCEGVAELLFTENESNASPALGTAQSFAVRQRCVPPICHLRRDMIAVNSVENRHQSSRSLCAGRSRRRKQGCAFAAECEADERRIRYLRSDIRQPSCGCQRVFRPHYTGGVERRRTSRPSASAGGNDVVQAVLLFRSG